MRPLQTCRWHEFDSLTRFERAAERFILERAERAIAARGMFRIVLAGGNTPRRVYRLLRSADADWRAWHIYFGDERCLPAEDPGRNSRMAGAEWLDHVPVPSRQIHPIPAEHGPESAAADYAKVISGIDEFDLVLLGLGEDGHTASLFPGGAWDQSSALPAAIPVQDSPKPPRLRVSLSPERLSRARFAMFMVTGKSKQAAVEKWRKGVAIPAARVCPPSGADIFICLE